MFVTDPVEPLSSQLNQDPDKNLVVWGLYKIAVCVIYFMFIKKVVLQLVVLIERSQVSQQRL